MRAVTGSRGAETGKRLWERIDRLGVDYAMTDYWGPYEKVIPSRKHRQSKAETYAVEGDNSLFRHFLARFRRKSRCYGKNEKMLRRSALLLMAKWNGTLETILN